jgi:hypothetical protein
MKRTSTVLILCISFIACALIDGCSPSRSTQQGNQGISLFPEAGQYLGETVRLVTYDTLRPNMELQLDSIGDESEGSYRARYAVFLHDEPSHPAAFVLGEPVTVIRHEHLERHLQEYHFSGYTPEGILVDSATEIEVGSLMKNDTVMTTAKRKSLTGAELLRSLRNNDVPIRATFYFRDTADAAKQYSFTNCEFDRATIVPYASSTEEPTPTLLGRIVGGVIEFLVDLIVDPPHTDSSSSQDKKKDRAKSSTQKGRITSGEDRAK